MDYLSNFGPLSYSSRGVVHAYGLLRGSVDSEYHRKRFTTSFCNNYIQIRLRISSMGLMGCPSKSISGFMIRSFLD